MQPPLQFCSTQSQQPVGMLVHDGPLNGKEPLPVPLLLLHAKSATIPAAAHQTAERFIGTLL